MYIYTHTYICIYKVKIEYEQNWRSQHIQASAQRALERDLRDQIRRSAELKEEAKQWQKLCEALEAQLEVLRGNKKYKK